MCTVRGTLVLRVYASAMSVFDVRPVGVMCSTGACVCSVCEVIMPRGRGPCAWSYHAMHCCMCQHNAGRAFGVEHPARASPWKAAVAQAVMQLPGVRPCDIRPVHVRAFVPRSMVCKHANVRRL